jgi:small multidrug resistance family-3 protein
LLGIYVALFFVMAQIVARVRFGQEPTPPIYAGGALIVAGGMVIAFWKG